MPTEEGDEMLFKTHLPVLLRFEKTFTKGYLSGITIPQELRFVSVESESRWIAGIRAQESSGKLDWKLKLKC